MSPKHRSEKRRGFPPNLYETGGYYSWKHPKTGKHMGIGRNKSVAFRQAIDANMRLAGQSPLPSLLDRIDGVTMLWLDWLDEYEAILSKRKLADNTRKAHRSLLKRARQSFQDAPQIGAITSRMIAQVLEDLAAEGKRRLAQAFRSFLKDCLREAQVKGWIISNPVDVTRAEPVEVNRARLTFEIFQRLYAAESTPWLRNAMAVGLVSAQRREDISGMQFRDCRDGDLRVDQGKGQGQNRILIPLSLRLDVFGMSVADVVAQCRATGALSHYLIHQTQPFGNSPIGSQIWIDTISRRFSDAVAALGVDWGEKSPPTFHELRSLSERLYSAQGNVNTQELLGHKDARMTQTYHDSRGAEWLRVSVK